MVAVASAEEALEKVKDTAFEVVITDLMMPGINGIEILRKVKKVNSDISVIIITGYATVETAVEAMKEGAYDYLSKPFNLAEIKITVDRAVERQTLIRGVKEKDYYKGLSLIDGLTGLYNHFHFYHLLGQEIIKAQRYPQSVSLFMIDIDDFKIYNDTYGHLVGDEILRKLAMVLKKVVRKVDYVARYGGEEFSIILPQTDKEKSFISARRLMKVVEETQFKGEEKLPRGHLTISMGIAAYPEDATSLEELIHRADEALYKAKHSGKNQICLFNRGFFTS
ncbi:MAG: Response regulator PleD [Firmicutes bacterium]|nr:Response regulator PleD [Bacillota bacterium]